MKVMTVAEYNAIDAINWSTLKYARTSMLHYHHALNNPLDDSPRLIIGRAVHTAILEPEKLSEQYAVFEGARRAGKAWDAFEADNAGKTILRVVEMDAVKRAAEYVLKHPIASEWLNLDMALVERPIVWTDPVTGLLCKSRPDAVHASIVELKTVPSVDARDFSRHATKMGYFGQGAFQRRGYRELTKLSLPCAILAVEVDAPHDVAVFPIDEDSLRVADDEISTLLAKVAECRKTGVWPGRYQEPKTITLPEWARNVGYDMFDMEAA